MRNQLLRHYHTLETEPGCTLFELKASYRRLVKTWHPDRFHDNAREKSSAEERIKEINKAFQALSEFHKKFGHLPLDRDDKPPPRPGPQPEVRATVQETGSGNAPAAFWAHQDRTRGRSRMVQGLFFLALGGMLGLSYSIWDSTREPEDYLVTSQEEGNLIGSPDRTYKNGEDADGLSQGKTQTDSEYFTVGSSLGVVISAQGVPSKIEDGVWYYGKSKVYFSNGVVTGWLHDPADPLKADIHTPPEKHNPAVFTIGSSKKEVKTAQGAPMMESDNVWDYGVSKVYFEEGKVTGWYNSPMNPLRLEK